MIQQRSEVAVSRTDLLRDLNAVGNNLDFSTQILKRHTPRLGRFSVLSVLTSLMSIIQILAQHFKGVKRSQELPKTRRSHIDLRQNELLCTRNPGSDLLSCRRPVADIPCCSTRCRRQSLNHSVKWP